MKKNNIITIILLFILIPLILYLIKKIYSNIEPFEKTYAVCMWGQLRAINSTYKNLYLNLINPLQADLYIVAQKTNTDIDKNIELFEPSIKKILYDNPENIKEQYIDFDFNNEALHGNYTDDRHLKIYYNFYMIYKELGDIFEKNYEYIILTRSDFLHLFPYPDIKTLINDNNIIWSYDGHEYEGINSTLLCIPSKHIKTLLSSNYNYLNNKDNINILNNRNLCQERFMGVIFKDNNWINGKIQNNSFITADTINEITTTLPPLYSETHNVLYKYEYQLNNAYEALELYNSGKKWTFIKDKENVNRIILQ
jgi:hypothetical protein